MTANPPEPQDAVEPMKLAEKIIALHKLGELEEGAATDTVVMLAQAVLDKQEDIDKLEAVNEHIERVNNKRYNQLRIAEAQVTALRTALKAYQKIAKSISADLVTAHNVRADAASEWMREDDRDLRSAFHAARGDAIAALSTTPPAVPDTKSDELKGNWSIAALEDLRELIGSELPVGMIANARWAIATLPKINALISTALDTTPGGAALVFAPDTTAIVEAAREYMRVEHDYILEGPAYDALHEAVAAHDQAQKAVQGKVVE